MLTPQAGKSLIGWTLSVRFQPMSDLSTYGCQHELSNETDDEAKSDFYARLQRFIDGEARKDLILYLSLGVFNASVGSSNAGFETVMGNLGLGFLQ